MPRLSRRPRTTSASPWSRQRRTSVKVGAGDGGAGDRGNGMTLARRDMALMLTHAFAHPTRGWDARQRPSYNSALVTRSTRPAKRRRDHDDASDPGHTPARRLLGHAREAVARPALGGAPRAAA